MSYMRAVMTADGLRLGYRSSANVGCLAAPWFMTCRGLGKLDSEWTRHRRITSTDLPKRMNPTLQYRTIAREFGITRQRVARVAAELGINGRERQHQRTLLTFASLSENLSEQVWRSCH